MEQLIVRTNGLDQWFTLADDNHEVQYSMESLMNEGIAELLVSEGYQYKDIFGGVINPEGVSIYDKIQDSDDFPVLTELEQMDLTLFKQKYLSSNIRTLDNVDGQEPFKVKKGNGEYFLNTREEMESFIESAYNLYLKGQNTVLPLGHINQYINPEAMYTVSELVKEQTQATVAWEDNKSKAAKLIGQYLEMQFNVRNEAEFEKFLHVYGTNWRDDISFLYEYGVPLCNLDIKSIKSTQRDCKIAAIKPVLSLSPSMDGIECIGLSGKNVTAKLQTGSAIDVIEDEELEFEGLSVSKSGNTVSNYQIDPLTLDNAIKSKRNFKYAPLRIKDKSVVEEIDLITYYEFFNSALNMTARRKLVFRVEKQGSTVSISFGAMTADSFTENWDYITSCGVLSAKLTSTLTVPMFEIEPRDMTALVLLQSHIKTSVRKELSKLKYKNHLSALTEQHFSTVTGIEYLISLINQQEADKAKQKAKDSKDTESSSTQEFTTYNLLGIVNVLTTLVLPSKYKELLGLSPDAPISSIIEEIRLRGMGEEESTLDPFIENELNRALALYSKLISVISENQYFGQLAHILGAYNDDISLYLFSAFIHYRMHYPNYKSYDIDELYNTICQNMDLYFEKEVDAAKLLFDKEKFNKNIRQNVRAFAITERSKGDPHFLCGIYVGLGMDASPVAVDAIRLADIGNIRTSYGPLVKYISTVIHPAVKASAQPNREFYLKNDTNCNLTLEMFLLVRSLRFDLINLKRMSNGIQLSVTDKHPNRAFMPVFIVPQKLLKEVIEAKINYRYGIIQDILDAQKTGVFNNLAKRQDNELNFVTASNYFAGSCSFINANVDLHGVRIHSEYSTSISELDANLQTSSYDIVKTISPTNNGVDMSMTLSMPVIFGESTGMFADLKDPKSLLSKLPASIISALSVGLSKTTKSGAFARIKPLLASRFSLKLATPGKYLSERYSILDSFKSQYFSEFTENPATKQLQAQELEQSSKMLNQALRGVFASNKSNQEKIEILTNLYKDNLTTAPAVPSPKDLSSYETVEDYILRAAYFIEANETILGSSELNVEIDEDTYTPYLSLSPSEDKKLLWHIPTASDVYTAVLQDLSVTDAAIYIPEFVKRGVTLSELAKGISDNDFMSDDDLVTNFLKVYGFNVVSDPNGFWSEKDIKSKSSVITLDTLNMDGEDAYQMMLFLLNVNNSVKPADVVDYKYKGKKAFITLYNGKDISRIEIPFDLKKPKANENSINELAKYGLLLRSGEDIYIRHHNSVIKLS